MNSLIFKWIVKIGFVILVLGLFLFYIFYSKNKLQNKSPIDAMVTYTTVSKTFTTPLNIQPSPEDIVNSISDFVIVPDGGLDWKILAKTKSEPFEYKDDKGHSIYGVKPVFTHDLMPYDNQMITMQGYMFPLNADKSQNMFLFGPFPISCPYHYHVGPALVIEAHGFKPIKFRYEPITIKGVLELVREGNEYNIFYRLKNVEIIK